MTFGVYYVVSQGNIVDADMLRPNNRHSFQLQINATSNMIPKSKIIVATLVKQRIVYDVMDIEFDQLLNNFDMDIENKEVKPPGRIQLNIRGRPGSYVALAAYDKTLRQSRSGFDFSWHDVEQLYAQFHVNDFNQYDILQSIGIFARASRGLTSSRDMEGRYGRLNASKKRIAYRTKFAETFLWKHDILQRSGRLNLIANVPHTITQWYLTGFSMHPEYGLGIIKKPIEFTTKKSFYLTDHLPYSIKRGEPVQMIFTLFNYGSEATLANATMYNVENQIEFIGHPSGETNCTKSVRIQSHESIVVSFLVKAKKLGEILVRVQASTEYDTDAIEKFIRVMPESLLVQNMESRIFSHRSYGNVSHIFLLDIPKTADAGSKQIVFSVKPIAPVLIHNLGNLLSVPTGSGEQNLVHFACNSIVLDYLIAIGSNNMTLLDRATSLVRQGFQNQMRYRQKDGSFGIWQTSEGSVFLTAFVAKSIQTAAKHIDKLDKTMITSSFQWLASKQHSSGRFNEVGQVLQSDMQGGLRNGVTLTSFVLIAFMENEQAKVTHAGVVAKGIEYVASMLPNVSDLYDLSIATYALMLNNHSQKNRYLQTLVDRSTINGTMRYWASEPHGIETTAYALLAMIQANRYLDGFSVMPWLANQSYDSSRFSRTQDTFVGLKALSSLAEIISPSRNDYIIRLKYQKHVKLFQNIPQHTDRIEFNMPSDVHNIIINIVGKGFMLVAVRYEYSVNLRNYSNRFRLQVDKLNTTSSDELQLEICTSFIPSLAESLSNIALVEVTFPSGYIVNDHPIEKTTPFPIRNGLVFNNMKWKKVIYVNYAMVTIVPMNA
uniref:Alpha-2-macroglobulin domain-containing protein n=1 Tax=Anopheles atroparvus TaxID=41427 RepID=A0A182JMD8_ANOAO